MNIDIFKRNVSLLKLGISKLEGEEKIIYEFLINKLSGLNTYVKGDNRSDWVYFGKNEISLVLRYSSSDKTLWIENKIRICFELQSLNYNDIESLIIWWVGLTLDLKPKGIGTFSSNPPYGVILKLKEKDEYRYF